MNWFTPSWNEKSNKTEATKIYMVLRCHSHVEGRRRVYSKKCHRDPEANMRDRYARKNGIISCASTSKISPNFQQTYTPFWPPTVPNVYFQNEFFCFPAKGWVRLSSTGEFSFFDRSDRCVAYKSLASHAWSFLDDSPLNFEVNIKYCFT